MTSFSNQLHREVDLAVEQLFLTPHAQAVLTGQATARELAQYYVTAHQTVMLAPELLERCYWSLCRSGSAPELIDLVAAKRNEEQGHHHWLEEDLTAIGYPLSDPESPRPGVAAEAYASFHRNLIDLCGVSFLGTAWVLESLAARCAGQAAVHLGASGRIRGIDPASARGVRFLTRHHEEDQGHVAELANVLGRAVTDVREREYVLMSARFTALTYPEFFAGRPGDR